MKAFFCAPLHYMQTAVKSFTPYVYTSITLVKQKTMHFKFINIISMWLLVLTN